MSIKSSEIHPSKSYEIDPDCGGLPICPPPTKQQVIGSVVAAGAVFGATDMLFYSTIGKSFMNSVAKEMPDAVFMTLGYVVAAVMFCLIYAKYARISKRPFDPDKESENSYRLKKGLRYGLAIGALVFIPSTLFNYAVLQDLNLWNQSMDVIFHLLQYTVVGIMTAFIQKAKK
ncbi:MAG: hypothetical protein HKN68_12590 [Saprospiraceae bacterium]|nr:hypothetical protein [Saprospiraceae bacterium]